MRVVCTCFLLSVLSGLSNGWATTIGGVVAPRLRVCGVLRLPVHESLLQGAVPTGASLAALGCALFANGASRRLTVLVGETIMLVASAASVLAEAVHGLILARLLMGIGVGICSMAKPLIVSEMAPPSLRGTLVGLFMVGQAAAPALVFALDAALPDERSVCMSWPWRLELALGAAAAVPLMLVASVGMPQDRGKGHTVATNGCRVLLKALADAEVRRGFIIGAAINVAFNLSSWWVLVNYAPALAAVFARRAGDGEPPTWVTGGMWSVAFVAVLWGAVASDRLGRRAIILTSCALSSACLAALVIGCMRLASDGGVVGAAQTLLGLDTLLVLNVFVTGIGLTSVRATIVAELLPREFRLVGVSISQALGWALVVFNMMAYPELVAAYGLLHGSAIQFGVSASIVAGVGLGLVWYLPETKGRVLD